MKFSILKVFPGDIMNIRFEFKNNQIECDNKIVYEYVCDPYIDKDYLILSKKNNYIKAGSHPRLNISMNRLSISIFLNFINISINNKFKECLIIICKKPFLIGILFNK